MTNLDPKTKAPIWKPEEWANRLDMCRSVLYMHGFVTDGESDRINSKIAKWAKANGMTRGGGFSNPHIVSANEASKPDPQSPDCSRCGTRMATTASGDYVCAVCPPKRPPGAAETECPVCHGTYGTHSENCTYE